MSAARTVVVTGATGRQGGAVARRLLAQGWAVRALTRHPDGAAALALAALGAELAEGDLDSRASLDRAFKEAHGVFGVTDFWEHGYEAEVRQGKTLVDAAVAAGIRHFVFNSVGGAERTAGLGISHFDTKREIERHLRQSGLQFSIFRPVTFFENFITPRFRQAIRERGILRFGIEPDQSFQMVAMEDVSTFVLRAFENPDHYAGRALELASDRFSLRDFAAALGDAIGRSVRYQYVPRPLQQLVAAYVSVTGACGHYKVGPSLVHQFSWNNRSATGGWDADLAALRQLHPGLLRMRDWVSGVDWKS